MVKILDRYIDRHKKKSILKFKFINRELLINLRKKTRRLEQIGQVKTNSRSSTILPCLVNKRIHIYNGKKYIPIIILPEYLGLKLGNFVFTRRFIGHKKQGKKLKVRSKKALATKESFNYIKQFNFNNCISRKEIFIENRK